MKIREDGIKQELRKERKAEQKADQKADQKEGQKELHTASPRKPKRGQELVRIDAEQMEYIRYYSELSGVPIAAVVRESLTYFIECIYPPRIRSLEKEAKAEKLSRIKLVAKKH
jgi:hypothetical protein